MILKKNPLLEKPVLTIDEFGLERAFESGKVRESFYLHDANLLLIDTDRTGAYDQPHCMIDGRPAFYPGKGILINAFNQEGEALASDLMPTDFVEMTDEYKKTIPEELWPRCAVHLPVNERILIEAIVRTGCEGSMAKTAKEGKLLCGQEISSDLLKGDMLDKPMFTPTSKAPKGEKDKPYTLDEYYQEVGDKAIANYIYGMSVLLHLSFKAKASDSGLDHPDDKFEFGIYPPGLPICNSKNQPAVDKKFWEASTRLYFQSNGFKRNAYLEMPNFDFDLFVEFAIENANAGIVRLIDERASTDSSRYRSSRSTAIGRELREKGYPELAQFMLNDFLCKEWFRMQSKATGKGGYDNDSKQIVTLEDWVLAETGQRNLKTYLMLYGG